MSKPVKLEHFRYVGDKSKRVFYDLDLYDTNPDVKAKVDDLLERENYIAISPQTQAEARNRGYRPDRSVPAEDEA